MPAVAQHGAWSIRPAGPEDAPAVVRLFEESFGKPASEAWYRWKVLDSPWPVGAPTGWLALDGERVVGHYAGTPLRFRLEGEELRVVHTCDAMTAPDFRRKGVLTGLGAAANEAWAAAGAAFVIGLPTAKWGTRSAQIGYRSAFQLGWLWRPLHSEALMPTRAGRARFAAPALRLGASVAVGAWDAAWGARTRRSAPEVDVEELACPGPEIDRLWERLRNAYDASTVRDRAWLAYRYAAASTTSYHLLLARRAGEPLGYLVYRTMTTGARRTGWIVELFTPPYDPPVSAALISSALDRLRAAGAHDARAFAAPGTPFLRSLRSAGFLRRIGTYDVSLIPLAGPCPPEVMSDPTRWLFAAGDSDVL